MASNVLLILLMRRIMTATTAKLRTNIESRFMGHLTIPISICNEVIWRSQGSLAENVAHDRSDIESIFLPIFQRIFDLIKEQLDGVATKGSRAAAKVSSPLHELI
jgi:hypothetical protein